MTTYREAHARIRQRAEEWAGTLHGPIPEGHTAESATTMRMCLGWVLDVLDGVERPEEQQT